MKTCSKCKYRSHTGYCLCPSLVFSNYKFLEDPLTGAQNSVSCEKYNKDGNCIEYKEGLNFDYIPIWIILFILLVCALIFMIGVGVGQGLGK